MRHRFHNNRGAAMVISVFFMVVLYALSGIFVLRAVHDNQMARVERESSKAFYAAQAGAEAALYQLDVLINTYLMNTISSASPSGVISYAASKVASGNGVEWLTYAVRNNNVAVLTENGEQAEYAGSGALQTGSYAYVITMTEKEDPSDAGVDAWDFPYSYMIESTGSSSGETSRVVVHGDFTVRLQRDNFAKFALFTNTQTMPNGTQVWFTDSTVFSGPVHTNDRFNFALNPSGSFYAAVSQHQETARFYNNGSSILLDADVNGTRDVPVFHAGFGRDQDSIVLNSSTVKQDMIDQATGGQAFGANGIYIPNNGTALTGGIFVKGDSSVSLTVDGNNRAVYTIEQGGVSNQVTVDSSSNQTIVTNLSSGTSATYSGVPDGTDDAGTIIYVDGSISSLGGTVQEGTSVTIATTEDVVIQSHLKYSDYTPGSGTPGVAGYTPPTAVGTDNLLGIVSWEGDVRIGTSAPDNLEVHGTVLAQSGIFAVDSYNDTGAGARGSATLLGGVISDNYGAFGLFNGTTGQFISGYGRNFVYDERMQAGTAPPYFPSLNTFIAFTNDITDKVIWQEGY